MTWTKLGDDFNDRQELLDVSRSARLLYVEMYVYANRLTLDGRIPRARLPRFSDCRDQDLDDLVRVGLVEVDGSDLLVDWTDQESAAEVRSRRQYRAETQARYRRRKTAHERGDHGLCDPRYCKGVTGNEGGNETGNETPSRPAPSRPQQGQGQEPPGSPPGGSPPSRSPATGALAHQIDLPGGLQMLTVESPSPHHIGIAVEAPPGNEPAMRAAHELLETILTTPHDMRRRHHCDDDPDPCDPVAEFNSAQMLIVVPRDDPEDWWGSLEPLLIDHLNKTLEKPT